MKVLSIAPCANLKAVLDPTNDDLESNLVGALCDGLDLAAGGVGDPDVDRHLLHVLVHLVRVQAQDCRVPHICAGECQIVKI